METVTLNEAARLAATDFSLWALFMRADIVVKLVMLGLIAASVLSWSIIIEKALTYRRVRRQAEEFEAMFWSGETLQNIYRQLANNEANPSVRVFNAAMMMASAIAILTTIGILLSLIFETLRFFDKVPVMDFLFGLSWSPQIAMRADQIGGAGAFGAIPLFAGTMMITFIAMLVAVPIGLMSAIYLSEYANPKLRGIAKPGIEILAGVPTVVYGFFAALMVAPFLRDSGADIGLTLSSESALAVRQMRRWMSNHGFWLILAVKNKRAGCKRFWMQWRMKPIGLLSIMMVAL